MRTTTANRVNEWVEWWNWHSATLKNASVEKKLEFLALATQGALELITLLTEEIREVENGRSSEKKIVLPIGIRFNEPIRQEKSA